MKKRSIEEIVEYLNSYFNEYLIDCYGDKTKFDIRGIYKEKNYNTSFCELQYTIRCEFPNLMNVVFEIIFEYFETDQLIPNIRQVTFENKNNRKFLEDVRLSFYENFNKNYFISHILQILKTRELTEYGSIKVDEN